MSGAGDSKLTDAECLRSRYYATAKNLQARINIYRKFLKVEKPWHQWVFDRLALAGDDRVADLGCGSCELWSSNLSRVPETVSITLVDISPGMLLECGKNVGEDAKFSFLEQDLNKGLRTNETYTLVVACHMLYHVSEKDAFLESVRGHLRRDGRAVFTTVGGEHLARVNELVNEYEGRPVVEQSVADHLPPADMEQLLSRYFGEVAVEEFAGELLVTEAEPLSDYILASYSLSGDRYQDPMARRRFEDYVRGEVEAEKLKDGAFRIRVQNFLMKCGSAGAAAGFPPA